MEDIKFNEFKIKDITEYPPSFSPKKPNDRKHFIKYLIIFVIILIIFAGGLYLWDNYLSPSARKAREAQENYQKYLDWQKDYEDAMRADTYGGKTPQETLDMFVNALEKEDIDLASKYFIIGETTTQDEWRDGLAKKRDEGTLDEIIDKIQKSKINSEYSWSETTWFNVKDSNGNIESSIILKINKYSQIWKIESM
ncbi:MAG TPA: hypothetical protein PK367_01445 [Candidatus Paceibacterota bacterium]|nr:hypothetical protein [Candidatus Paceibacterota bacterium]